MYLFDKKLNLAAKIQLTLFYLLSISLVIALISSLISKSWDVLFIASLTLLLTFIPVIIKRKFSVSLPIELEFLVVLFIYTGLFLGDLHGYYTKFWWFDIVLHTTSGVGLGFAGFIILFILYHDDKIKTSPFLIAVFSFTFALAMGALWEILEFGIDNVFNTNLQNNGLFDTMTDLIVDSLGALFASFIGYLYIKKGQVMIFDKYLNRFIQENPRLFGEQKKSK